MPRPRSCLFLAAAMLMLASGASAFTSFPNATCPDTLSIVRLRTLLNTAAACAPQTGPGGAIGDTVRGVGGIVTGFDELPTGFNVHLQQSAGGPSSGIDVFTHGLDLRPVYGLNRGDSVVVEYARVTLLAGELQLESPNNSSGNPNIVLRKVSSAQPLPPFFVGTTTQLKEAPSNTFAEQYEGGLVRIPGPLVVARTSRTGGLGGNNAFLVIKTTVPGDSVFIDGDKLTTYGPPAVGTTLTSVQGIVNQTTRGYRIMLRDGDDIQANSPPNLVDAYPITDNTILVKFDRNVTNASATNTNNYSLASFGSVDGAIMQGQAAVLLSITNGLSHGDIEVITANGVVNLASGQTMTTPQSQVFVNGLLTAEEVQRPNPDSLAMTRPPCLDRSRFAGGGGQVSEGALGPRCSMSVIAASRYGTLYFTADAGGELRGGAAAFAPAGVLTIGHQYRLTGRIQEFFGETQLSDIVAVADLGASTVPAPQVASVIQALRDTCDFSNVMDDGEDREGQLVTLSSVRVVQRTDPLQVNGFHVAELASPDTIFVENLNDALTPLASPTLGSIVSVTGTVHFSGGSFRVTPRNYSDISTSPIGVPSAGNSTCPTVVTMGPNGSCCFDVVVRDLLNNPIPGSLLAISFGACPITWCPTQPAGVTVNVPANTVHAVTNAAGQAHVCICATSANPTCATTIYADGVPLSSLQAAMCASPGDTCAVEGWQLVAGSGPAPRWSSAEVADDLRGTVFLFGGAGAGGDLGDTWEWDGTDWNATATSGPSARQGHAMAYDRARGRVVLFGGRVAGVYDQQTWEWEPVGGWSLRSSAGPGARAGHVLAYDENLHQVILFGGYDGIGTLGDTWTWNGSAWSPVGSGGPATRMNAAMACDPLRKRVVLYGGSTGPSAAGALSDTWEWDGSVWTRVVRPVWNGSGFSSADVAGPPARWRHGMAFGASCGRILVTGGETASGALAPTTWSWDGANWREGVPGLQLASAPIAFDIARGKLTTFGGNGPAGLSGQTFQLCTPCDDEAAEMDSLGNVLYPPTLDLNEPITELEIEEQDGEEVGLRYPGFHTSADSWLKNFPCATAIGGTVPVEASDPAIDDSLQAMGIDISAQAMADSLSAWEQQILQMQQGQPDGLAVAPPVDTGAYPLPGAPHCPNYPAANYVFGGRDIVFVHGLQLKHVFRKMAQAQLGNTNDPSFADWVPPTATQHGYQLNPEFYRQESTPGAGDGGFYWQIAHDNWDPHIFEFFIKRNIRNRILIVSYPCNDRLEVEVQAVLTQINDAMRYGVGVHDLDGSGTTKFGTPSFVIVSHSTGGLVADAALYAAKHYSNLNAEFIADRCKAHVGLASALSGSRLATAGLAVAGYISTVSVQNHPWLCPLFRGLKDLFDKDEFPALGCGLVVQIAARSVLVDLVPAYTQYRWGPAIDNTGIPTVNLTGAHSQMVPLLKHTISPGYDDGVLNVNCAAPNPGTTLLWPSGFITEGPLGMVQTYDMGMAKQARPRAIQYYIEQAFDRRLNPLLKAVPFYVAAGPLTYLSPTGMLQSVGWEFPGTGLDPTRRFHNHYSFMTSAADHFNVRSADQYPDYMRHLALFEDPPMYYANYEEARALREEDEPAMRATYNTIGLFHYPNDDQPLMTAACTPAVYDRIKGVQRGFKIKIFGKTYSKYWWIWKRHYIQPANIMNKHVCDYMYASILNCQSPVGPCGPVDVAGDAVTRENFARVLDNPSPVGKATVEFGLRTAGRVRIGIYDLAGRRIVEIVNRPYLPGVYRAGWNGTDAAGGRIRPGLYFVRVEFPDQHFLATNKAMFLR